MGYLIRLYGERRGAVSERGDFKAENLILSIIYRQSGGLTLIPVDFEMPTYQIS